MAPPVRIDFCDFWPSFDRHDNFFTDLLRPHFDVQVVNDPDFLIHSCFGKRHRRFSGIRIYYTAENRRPDFCVSDFAFSFDYLDRADHCRFPFYVYRVPVEQLMLPSESPEEILASKVGFCSFVYSNSLCRRRNEFFRKLSKYKRVDSGGRFLNNVGGPVPDKLAFQRQYKFAFAFENSSYPGYTTEKLPEAVAAGAVPIYWGNSLVNREFNPARFLHYDDYGSDEALIERIIELDNDDAKYLEYLRQPLFYDNRPNEYYDPSRLVAQFEQIFDTKKRPAAYSWPKYLGFQTKRLGRNFQRLLPKAG
jgi:hypothetical protein